MKILFVKLGAIGDVLMARGLPAEARRRHPGARFSWVVGRGAAALPHLFEGVDEVIEADDAALLRGGPTARAGAFARLWLRLAGRRFDKVLTGHADPRYALLGAAAFAGERRAFGSGLPLPGRWHGDEYVRLLDGADPAGLARPALKPLRPRLDPALAVRARGARAVLLFPGGARNLLRDDALRRWPLGHYAALARLLRRRGRTVWIGGAASDAWVRDAFKGTGAVDLLGAADLPQTLALCARAAAVVTHDSGPLHLAQAAGAPTVALFGPTQPHEKVDPRAGAEVLWGGADLACRPCYDGRDYAACSDNRCLASVTPAAVLAALRRL